MNRMKTGEFSDVSKNFDFDNNIYRISETFAPFFSVRSKNKCIDILQSKIPLMEELSLQYKIRANGSRNRVYIIKLKGLTVKKKGC